MRPRREGSEQAARRSSGSLQVHFRCMCRQRFNSEAKTREDTIAHLHLRPVRIYIYICIPVSVHICVRIYFILCVYLCIYIHIYIYIYIYIHA